MYFYSVKCLLYANKFVVSIFGFCRLTVDAFLSSEEGLFGDGVPHYIVFYKNSLSKTFV